MSSNRHSSRARKPNSRYNRTQPTQPSTSSIIVVSPAPPPLPSSPPPVLHEPQPSVAQPEPITTAIASSSSLTTFLSAFNTMVDCKIAENTHGKYANRMKVMAEFFHKHEFREREKGKNQVERVKML